MIVQPPTVFFSVVLDTDKLPFHSLGVTTEKKKLRKLPANARLSYAWGPKASKQRALTITMSCISNRNI